MSGVIHVDLTVSEFKQKAFLETVYYSSCALKLYMLADKSEILLLSSICHYIAIKESFYSIKRRQYIVLNYPYSTLDTYIETLEAFHKRCFSLSVNKDKSFPYLTSVKNTVINNWSYFNPNTRKKMNIKFNRTNLRTLD